MSSTVPSPCVNVCRMGADTDLCEGCWRTIEEIAAWGRADDTQRLTILAEIQLRRGRFKGQGLNGETDGAD
jgi:uncharacterized protein